MSEPGAQTGPVLVPVDFSPPSEQAFLHAAEYALRCDAPLLVLHVVHDPEETPGVYRMEDDSGDLMPMMDAAKVLLLRFGERMRERAPGLVDAVRPEYELAKGLPPTRILEIAERVDARQIVLGNRGQSSLSRLVMGSTADRVARSASMPVTLVKAAAD